MKWIIAIVIVTIPQMFIAYSFMSIKDKPIQIEIVQPSKIKLSL